MGSRLRRVLLQAQVHATLIPLQTVKATLKSNGASKSSNDPELHFWFIDIGNNL
jgi:hypothetical protein